MTPRNAVNAIAFQLGWLACVLGGNGPALAAGALGLFLHWRLPGHDAREWRFIGVAALLGLAMDLGWQRLGLITFHGAGAAGIPPWLGVLWLLFATTLRHSLAWLQTRLWLAALAGAVAGPASYLAGLSLGAASSALPSWQLAAAMAPGWMLLLPLLAFLARPPARAAAAGAT